MKKLLLKAIFLSLLLSYTIFSTSNAYVYNNKFVKIGLLIGACGTILLAKHLWSKKQQRKGRSNSNAEKATLPENVKNTLDLHASELQELLKTMSRFSHCASGVNVFQKDWLPGYYIKYGIERVRNAQKFKDVIREHSLNLLSVADKYLYHVPGMPGLLSNENYLVIAKAENGLGGENQNLDLEQVIQLHKAAIYAKHYDLHPANYISQQDGTIVIIDTDTRAMPSAERINFLEQDWFKHGSRVDPITLTAVEIVNDPLTKLELALYNAKNAYDSQASDYLQKKITHRERLRLEKQGLKNNFIYNFTHDLMHWGLRKLFSQSVYKRICNLF